jgi:para-nitrobenzyl esterase
VISKIGVILMVRFLILVTCIFLGACAWFDRGEPVTEKPEAYRIKSSGGIVQGLRITSGGSDITSASVVSWFDIPFAEPPVGELRWRAPRAIEAPVDIIVEKEDTSCVQKSSDYAGADGEGIVGLEDCLYLDIKAPADFANKSYPVMFWIHGGGNTTGHKDYYDFTRLVAAQGVVVVTTNYRLGALGWFTHPAIQGEQKGLDKTSNFGTLDIIESLKWVQSNIAQFGGDAQNVTIFGESAGGHNVFALLASPLSDGLFHRAISQSGYTTSSSKQDAYNENGQNVLIERGAWQISKQLNAGSDVAANSKQMRNLLKSTDARALVALYYTGDGVDNVPLTTIDGIVIPEVGLLGALGLEEYAKNIPVIAGATKDEVSLWLGLHRYFVDVSYPFTKLLPPAFKVKQPDLFEFWIRTRSHGWKLRGADIPLQALETAGYKNLYAYRFDWDHQETSIFADFPNIIGAAHGTDIAFVTGQYNYGPISSYIYPEGPARAEMEATVMSAWSEFARSGIPDTDTSLQWSRFTAANPAYIHLDKDDLLRMSVENETMPSLLNGIADHSSSTDLEKCMIVWESLINVGDPQLDTHNAWNDGFCNKFDVRAEQKQLTARLVDEFGSVGVN